MNFSELYRTVLYRYAYCLYCLLFTVHCYVGPRVVTRSVSTAVHTAQTGRYCIHFRLPQQSVNTSLLYRRHVSSHLLRRINHVNQRCSDDCM
jgi:hypothetical protein